MRIRGTLLSIPAEVGRVPGGTASVVALAVAIPGVLVTVALGALGGAILNLGFPPVGEALLWFAAATGLITVAAIATAYVGALVLVVWCIRVPGNERRPIYDQNRWRWEAALGLCKDVVLGPRTS